MGDDHAVVGATIVASTSVTQAWADNGGLNFGAVEQIAIDVIAHDVTDKLVERGVPLCPGEAKAGRIPALQAGDRWLCDPAAVEAALLERARELPKGGDR